VPTAAEGVRDEELREPEIAVGVHVRERLLGDPREPGGDVADAEDDRRRRVAREPVVDVRRLPAALRVEPVVVGEGGEVVQVERVQPFERAAVSGVHRQIFATSAKYRLWILRGGHYP
jgi:hypothetical protein